MASCGAARDDLTTRAERLCFRGLFVSPFVRLRDGIHESTTPHGLVLLGVVVLGIVLLFALGGCGRQKPYSFHGETVEPPAPAVDFTLTGPDGKALSLSDFRGKLVVLYFGYTSCPDVCPTTMAALAQAMRDLGAKADRGAGASWSPSTRSGTRPTG